MSSSAYPTSRITLANGETHETHPSNPDMTRLELVGLKEGFSLKETPITAMTFIAWAYLKRNGKYSESWTQFRDVDCVEIDPDTDEDDEVDEDPKL